MDRATLKENAKKSLKGKYKNAIIVLLIAGVITFLVSFVSGIIGGALDFNENNTKTLNSIISFFVIGLFYFGYLSFFLKISRNKEVEVNELWSKTNMYLSYLGVSILVGIIVSIGFVLFIIPGIILALMYSQVLFIMLDDEKIGITDAMKKSREMMNGHKWEYFVLILSFFGWMFLGILTFGILLFWVVPYMNVTTCNFYNKLKEAK